MNTVYRQFLQAKPPYKFGALILLWLVLMLSFGGGVVFATHPTMTHINPEPPPPFFPGYIRDILEHAHTYPQTPAYAPWLSKAGEPHVTQVTVSSTDTFVDLEYHIAGIIGWSHASGGTAEAQNRVESISTDKPGHGFSAGATGSIRTLDYRPTPNTPGTFRHAGRVFTYIAPTGGFTPGLHIITIQQKSINRFVNGTYQCVGGSEAIVTAFGFSPAAYAQCQAVPVTLRIDVVVEDEPDINVQGRVYDASNGNVIQGVTATTCHFGNVISDTAGDLRFTVPDGAGYCIRVTGVPSGYDISTVRARPWGEGYFGCTASEPPTAVTCAHTTYECQEANRNVNGCGSPQDIDRAWDVGFDFVISPVSTGGPTPASCPTFSPLIRTVNLPATGIPSNSDAARHTYHSTQVTSIPDEWGQQASWTGGTNGSVDVDYSPYVTSYPYDTHKVTVRYRVNYTTAHYVNNPVPHAHPNGDINGDGIANDGTWTHWHDNWVYSHTSGPHASSTQATDAPDINPPCFDRTYDVTPEAGNATLLNGAAADNEDPTRATFGVRLTVDYGVDQSPPTGVNPMRVRTTVDNFPYTISYYIDRGLGADSGITDVNRTANLSAPNLNRTNNDVDTPLPTETLDVFVPGTQTGAGGTSLVAGDRICWRVYTTSRLGPSDTVGIVNVDGVINLARSNGGRVSPANPDWRCTEYVVDKPYDRAFGGDVIVGSNFMNNGTCAPVVGARIIGYNKGAIGAPTRFSGAGTQLAAFALGSINEYVSAATRTVNPQPLKGLTFANTGGTYGGNWDSDNIGCGPDYYKDRTGVPIGGTFTINGATDGAFIAGSDITLNVSGNIPKRRKIAIYVNGDVAIKSDIHYVPGTNTEIADIPSVRVIATGNIYIDPAVRHIDGILVSQGGRIYTCSDGSFGVPSDVQINGVCRTDLQITGALVAKSIGFYRSGGSLRAGSNSESSTSSNTAERIIYSPEVWLTNPAVQPPYKEPYEAFTSLPPIL